MHVPICCEEHLQNLSDVNHRKCQKAHSGIVSSRQGLGQARTLARCLYKKSNLPQASVLWSAASMRRTTAQVCERLFFFMFYRS